MGLELGLLVLECFFLLFERALQLGNLGIAGVELILKFLALAGEG